jgi:hypothetical protein
MLEPAFAARLRAALVSTAGGYLRNSVRQDRVTCAVCTTPVDGFRYYYPCNSHRVHGRLADTVAFLTYAVAGDQSGYVMRGYKAQVPVQEHYRVVAMLALLGLSMHGTCPDALLDTPVTHWATVPSLPAKPGEHPFHRIVSNSARGLEVPLTAAAKVVDPRAVNPDHFSTDARLPSQSHVLLMDDTWTQGGHAQSAVLALRKAGAMRVSVLVVARWIKQGFGDNAQFLRDISGLDFDPEICPWTGEGCP